MLICDLRQVFLYQFCSVPLSFYHWRGLENVCTRQCRHNLLYHVFIYKRATDPGFPAVMICIRDPMEEYHQVINWRLVCLDHDNFCPEEKFRHLWFLQLLKIKKLLSMANLYCIGRACAARNTVQPQFEAVCQACKQTAFWKRSCKSGKDVRLKTVVFFSELSVSSSFFLNFNG